MRSGLSEKKLRNTIHHTVKTFANTDSQFPSIYFDLIDPNRSTQFRIFWVFTVAACFLICLSQITERIIYYFSRPLAVDVYIDDMQSLKFPIVEICSADNDYLKEIMKDQFEYDILSCVVPHVKVWDEDVVDPEKVWQYKNKSNVLDKIEFEKGIVMNNINLTLRKSIFGQCTRLDINETLKGKKLDFKLKIHLFPGACKKSFTMAAINDKIDFQMVLPIVSGYRSDYKIMFRSYHFINTLNSPCASEEELIECYKKCMFKRFSEEATCKLPFFDPSINLTLCNVNDLENTKRSYMNVFKATLIPKVYTNCKCRRTCTQLVNFPLPTIEVIDENESVITIAVDRLQVSFIYKHIYDGISLLTDISGSLTLFVGLSLLAIADVLQTVKKLVDMKKKYRVNKLSRLELLILKSYNEILPKVNESDEIKMLDKKFINSYLKIVILLLCISLVVFMIQDRATYYFKFPTRNMVKLDSQTKVAFPSLTVCGDNLKVPYYKQKLIKQNRVNITNWCDIELLDLFLTQKKFTLEYLWHTTQLESFSSALQMIMDTFEISLKPPTETIIATHLGNCNHYKFTKSEYVGFFTLHMIPFIVFNTLPSYECPNSAYKIFVSDFNSSDFETFDQLTTIHAPIHTSTVNDVGMRVFQRLNTATNRCIEKSEFKKCRRSCIVEKIQRAEVCKLPFLVDVIENLLPCESSIVAKKSLKTYLNIANNLTKSCPCIRSCADTVFNVNSYSHVQLTNQPFFIAFLMLTNLVEHIIEIKMYTFIAFCCDIGNCFALCLGIGVLSLFRYSFKSILWVQNNVKKETA